MEWRKNRIAIGAVAFFVLLGVTLWAVNSRNRQPSASGEIPTIELGKGAITALEITRPEGEPVVLSSVDGVWRVTEPLDAAADQNNVRVPNGFLRRMIVFHGIMNRKSRAGKSTRSVMLPIGFNLLFSRAFARHPCKTRELRAGRSIRQRSGCFP